MEKKKISQKSEPETKEHKETSDLEEVLEKISSIKKENKKEKSKTNKKPNRSKLRGIFKPSIEPPRQVRASSWSIQLNRSNKKVKQENKKNKKEIDSIKEEQKKDIDNKKTKILNAEFRGQIKFIDINAPVLNTNNNQGTSTRLENFVQQQSINKNSENEEQNHYGIKKVTKNTPQYSTGNEHPYENNLQNQIQTSKQDFSIDSRKFNINENQEVRTINNSKQGNLEKDYVSVENFQSSDKEDISGIEKREFSARKYQS